jgi:predicted O-methyltransferase YrrM
MSYFSRYKSFIFRLDYLKINKTSGIKKLFFFLMLKKVNAYRWIKAMLILNSVNSLDDYFYKLNIIWYGGNEGHTQQVTEETNFLVEKASEKQDILEIGFNGGHSSETFLSSNNTAHITSVDIGFHHYVKFGRFYLKRKFRNRFELHLGPSSEILPKLIRQKNKYDLIFIDGSHEYLDVKKDLKNSLALASKDTILILDDVFFPKSETDKNYFDGHNVGPTKAWSEMIDSNQIDTIDYLEFESSSTNKRSIVSGVLSQDIV